MKKYQWMIGTRLPNGRIVWRPFYNVKKTK